MNDHENGTEGRGIEAADSMDQSLLRRWRVASARVRQPSTAELLGRRTPTDRPGRRRGVVAAALAATLTIAVASAGVAVWVSYRAASAAGPSSSATAPVQATSSRQAATASPSVAPIALAEQESIYQLQRTGSGGWVLTNRRLLISDGTTWRECWVIPTAPESFSVWRAFVDGSTVKVFADQSMWLSTDGCADWTRFALPVGPVDVAFVTTSIGYLAGIGQFDPAGMKMLPTLYRTDDGGQHWAVVTDSFDRADPGVIRPGYVGVGVSISFTDVNDGLMSSQSMLWSTRDAGRTWQVVDLHIPASSQFRLDWVSAPVSNPDGSAVIVAKLDGTPGMDGAKGRQVIYTSANRGESWKVAATLDDPGSLTVSLMSPSTWIAMDTLNGTTVQATKNSGLPWRTTAIKARWQFTATSVSFADVDHGWLAVIEPNPPCPSMTSPSGGVMHVSCDYAFLPPQHLWATEDGGATWHEVLH